MRGALLLAVLVVGSAGCIREQEPAVAPHGADETPPDEAPPAQEPAAPPPQPPVDEPPAQGPASPAEPEPQEPPPAAAEAPPAQAPVAQPASEPPAPEASPPGAAPAPAGAYGAPPPGASAPRPPRFAPGADAPDGKILVSLQLAADGSRFDASLRAVPGALVRVDSLVRLVNDAPESRTVVLSSTSLVDERVPSARFLVGGATLDLLAAQPRIELFLGSGASLDVGLELSLVEEAKGTTLFARELRLDA